MKLTTVLASSNDNPKYYKFIPKQILFWKLFNIKFIAVFVGEKIPDELIEYKDNIVLWDKPTNYILHTAYIAQNIRIYYTALLNLPDDEMVMITDMDMLPMNDKFYKEGLDKFEKKDFIYYRHIDGKQIYMCYNAAHPSVWSDVFNIKSDTDIVRELVNNYNKNYDGIPGTNGWFNDQEIMYSRLISYPYLRVLNKPLKRLDICIYHKHLQDGDVNFIPLYDDAHFHRDYNSNEKFILYSEEQLVKNINNSSKKIIDCFIFYNELDLLTYRLNILNNVVDYFIIVEATHTHTGHNKSLIFNENKQLFEQFKDKIIHIIVNDFPYKHPNINYDNDEQWKNENHQRNCIKNGINKLSLNNDDIIIISDLDEIPDPNTLNRIKNNEINVDVSSLEMDMYYYNLNSKHANKWTQAKIFSYKKYIELSISCNNIRHYVFPIIKNGGWHLSYFGDSLFIKNKIEHFAHQELNNNDFTNIDNIEKRIKNFGDLYDRNNIVTIQKILIQDNNYLPPEYKKYLRNFIVL